jgi:hypothetical protein
MSAIMYYENTTTFTLNGRQSASRELFSAICEKRSSIRDIKHLEILLPKPTNKAIKVTSKTADCLP